jgi:hypothetical protein
MHTQKVGRDRICRVEPRALSSYSTTGSPSDAKYGTGVQASGIRSTFAAHTKSFSESPRMACVV